MQCQMWTQLSQELVQTFKAGAMLLQCLSIDTDGPQNLRKAHEFYSQSFRGRDWGHRENGLYQTHSPVSSGRTAAGEGSEYVDAGHGIHTVFR